MHLISCMIGRNVEKLIKLIKRLVDEKFHGKIIIHFAQGIPKKIETNEVSEI